MSNSRINRGGRPIPGAFNAEFTPGQMVIGICVMVFAMVGSFGAGILVAKMDPSFQKAASLTGEAKPPAPDSPATTKASTPAPPPPRNSAPTPTPPPATPAAVPPLPPAPKPDSPDGPHSVVLPPLPAAKNSNKPVEVPVQMPAPVTPATSVADAHAASPAPEKAGTKPAPTPTPPPPAADLPPLPVAKTAEKTEPAKPAAPETAKEEKLAANTAPKKGAKSLDIPVEKELMDPVAPGSAKAAGTKAAAKQPAATPAQTPAAAAPSGGGTFGIQVGAFPGANREAQAADLKKKVDAAGLQAEVRPSKDKQYYRVLVVGYGDRAAAIKSLNDLKQRPGFEKAFVQDLSKL